MNTMKKIVAILAAVLMLCSILPMAVFAAEDVTINTYANTGTLSGSTSISWESGNYQVVNYKNTSSTAIRTSDSDHFRYYVGNKLVISGKDGALMSKVVITCTGNSYMLNNASNTLGAGWTVSASGTTLTYTPDAGSASELTITIGKQSRSSKIVITPVESEEPPVTCEHEWNDATCTEPKTCSLCSETEGEALGHSYGEGEETVAPDCTTAGEMEYTCSACGDVKTETVNALGHNYVDGICSVCGEELPLEATIDFSTTGQRTEFSTASQKWENDGLTLINNKAGSSSNVADYSNPIRMYKTSEIVISFPGMTSLVINATGIGSSYLWEATLDAAGLTYTVSEQVYTITFAEPTDSITLTAANQVRANSITASAVKADESDCEHDYVGVQTKAPSCTETGVTTYTCSKCGDEYTEAIAVIPHDYAESIIDSTCSAIGTATYTCSVCGDSYSEEIPLKNHNYVDDVCVDCGAVKAYKGTIDFSTKEQRTEYSTSTQKWENEGLTLINNKASATTNIGDYYNPGRFYKSTEIIISFPEMVTLIIDAAVSDSKYSEPWADTLGEAGYTYTVADGIYTITFAEPVNSIKLTTTAQVRANSITAIAAHEHVYAHDFDTACDKCGAVRDVVGPVAFGGNSRSEDVSGLAFKFDVAVDGMAVNGTTAIYDDATINGYKLVKMGAIVSNAKSELDIAAVYLCDLEADSASYAVRIINIPEANYGDAITAVPYFVVEIDGVETTVYGEAQVASYNG